MTTLFVLAHYDDEYGAWPLIEARRRGGHDMLFAYLAPSSDAAARRRRVGETRSFLGSFGLSADAVWTGGSAVDGGLIEAAEAARDELRQRIADVPVDEIVTLAWEGGHTDHDLCAAIAVGLGLELGAGVTAFSLYQGQALPGPLFHGARLLPASQGGERMRLSAGRWLSFALAVRHYPSQYDVWSTLWPAMLWSYTLFGYRTQRLAPERLSERPHAGPLLYERRCDASFEAVAAAAARVLERPRPAAAAAGGRRP
jgi:hypothetical protein